MKNDILYSFRRCPFAIRVRWALLICETNVELREIDLKNKPLDFLERSSTKTVPLLIKKNNETIEESLDIVLWALSESKNTNLRNIHLPKIKEKEIFEIIDDNDNKFKFHLDRFKYANRYQINNEEFHFIEAIKFIKSWDELLTQNRFLTGENPTIADWCIWPFVRQFKIACVSQKRTNYFNPPIKNWLEGFENNKIFKPLMRKYSLWQPNSKTNYFLIN